MKPDDARLFYHVARRELHAGEALSLGAYGQRVRERVGEVGYERHLVEMLFEQVRAAQFAHCPSRLGAAFLFADWTDAQAYFAYACNYGFGIYEVAVPASAQVHQGEMLWLQCEGADYTTILRCAQQYWSGELLPNSITKESVAIGDLRVLRRCL